MNKSLNLSGIILSFIGNLVVFFSSLFNFILPDIYADYSMIFTPLYVLSAITLLFGLTSLTISVLLLLSFRGSLKNIKCSRILNFILIFLNLLTIILFAISLLLYGWGLAMLNGLIIFALLTTSCIFLIICTLATWQTKSVAKFVQEVPKENQSESTSHEEVSSAQSKPLSPEDLQNKLNILSSMKNMDLVTEEEFSEIKKKLIYEYLEKLH